MKDETKRMFEEAVSVRTQAPLCINLVTRAQPFSWAAGNNSSCQPRIIVVCVRPVFPYYIYAAILSKL